MALDHFVPQVHLRKFYSPALGERLFATRKSDLKCFTPNAAAVCGINNGSTNAYLRDERIIEEFLKEIEPRYNDAVDSLRCGKIDPDTAFVVAGLTAYIASCSPAAMRMHSEPLKHTVEATAKILDAQGKFDPPPALFGRKSLTDLLESNTLKVTVDTKYPQAIGIANILAYTSSFGNGFWEIIINEHANESPFFYQRFSDGHRKRPRQHRSSSGHSTYTRPSGADYANPRAP